MSTYTPVVVTHLCTLFHNGLREIFAKSCFRPVRIESTLSEELETYLGSLKSGIWLVGVERCLSSTNMLVQRVVTTSPQVKAVILAAFQTPSDIIPALEAGACGFLCQDVPAERLLRSLELIILGEVVVHPQFSWGQTATHPIQADGEAQGSNSLQTKNHEPHSSADLVTRPSIKSASGDVARSLSRRETLILRMLIEGASNKVMARRLVITESTVKVHMKAILRKLRLQNRTQAAVWARNHVGEGGWNELSSTFVQ